MLEPGRIAPEFSLRDIAGERRSLRENLKRERVLAVFFKISCPTCQLMLPFLERLTQNVAVIGISQDDAGATKEFLEYFKITFPVLIDPKNEHYAVSGAYHLTNVPSLFLIQKDGKISWSLQGFHRGNLEDLAGRLGTALFTPNDKVPSMRPG